MGLPYLRLNDPNEARFIDVFHTWGDLLLTLEIANQASDPWTEALATRWTVVTAWASFELWCCRSLGVSKLQPFWPQLNVELAKLSPSLKIEWTKSPWDDLEVIRQERHPFAHRGAGGGRFPKRADAQLAVEEAERAIGRFAALIGLSKPRWVVIMRPTLPMDTSSGRTGGMSQTGPDPTQSGTIHVETTLLDGSTSTSHYGEGYDWRSRVDQILNGLKNPIRRVKVFDGDQVYLDRPLAMWGN